MTTPDDDDEELFDLADPTAELRSILASPDGDPWEDDDEEEAG